MKHRLIRHVHRERTVELKNAIFKCSGLRCSGLGQVQCQQRAEKQAGKKHASIHIFTNLQPWSQRSTSLVCKLGLVNVPLSLQPFMTGTTRQTTMEINLRFWEGWGLGGRGDNCPRMLVFSWELHDYKDLESLPISCQNCGLSNGSLLSGVNVRPPTPPPSSWKQAPLCSSEKQDEDVVWKPSIHMP